MTELEIYKANSQINIMIVSIIMQLIDENLVKHCSFHMMIQPDYVLDNLIFVETYHYDELLESTIIINPIRKQDQSYPLDTYCIPYNESNSRKHRRNLKEIITKCYQNELKIKEGSSK